MYLSNRERERERDFIALFIKAVNGGAIDCVYVRLELISVDEILWMAGGVFALQCCGVLAL